MAAITPHTPPIRAEESPPVTVTLGPTSWRERARRHRARVHQWTGPHRKRAARGEMHPVHDFLWRYYSLRPGQLERWHPGIGVRLDGEPARTFLSLPGYVELNGGIGVDLANLSPRRQDAIRWIRRLLEATAERPAQYGCFGWHEWAMVYRSPEVRHAGTPLRFPPDVLACIVESLPLCCTHFDAFRFFTPEARPLNHLQPTREASMHLEQRGCIHVTMDLYKWAYKLMPLVPSELVADAFALALAAREIDMRASPYDLRRLGFAPIRVETAAGRVEYSDCQRKLAEAAVPLRERLLIQCRQIEDEIRGT